MKTLKLLLALGFVAGLIIEPVAASEDERPLRRQARGINLPQDAITAAPTSTAVAAVSSVSASASCSASASAALAAMAFGGAASQGLPKVMWAKIAQFALTSSLQATCRDATLGAEIVLKPLSDRVPVELGLGSARAFAVRALLSLGEEFWPEKIVTADADGAVVETYRLTPHMMNMLMAQAKLAYSHKLQKYHAVDLTTPDGVAKQAAIVAEMRGFNQLVIGVLTQRWNESIQDCIAAGKMVESSLWQLIRDAAGGVDFLGDLPPERVAAVQAVFNSPELTGEQQAFILSFRPMIEALLNGQHIPALIANGAAAGVNFGPVLIYNLNAVTLNSPNARRCTTLDCVQLPAELTLSPQLLFALTYASDARDNDAVIIKNHPDKAPAIVEQARRLILAGNQLETTAKIVAPGIRTMSLRDCMQLKKLEGYFPELTCLDITNTPNLSADLSNFYAPEIDRATLQARIEAAIAARDAGGVAAGGAGAGAVAAV